MPLVFVRQSAKDTSGINIDTGGVDTRRAASYTSGVNIVVPDSTRRDHVRAIAIPWLELVMPKISRRAVLAGSLAAPVFTPTLPSSLGDPSMNSDGLASRAAVWIARDEHRTAMQLRWQDFESDVFDKAKRMNMDFSEAYESDMPEAQAMRALDSEIDEAFEWLHEEASEICSMRATTIAGAVAKIELGLKVQGPFDWQDHALELVEDGIAELRALIPGSIFIKYRA